VESDEELRAKLHDSRLSKAERERARALLAERGAPEAGKRDRAPSPSKSPLKLAVVLTLVGWVLTIAAAIGLALVLRVGMAEAFEIDGPAMAPGYQHGDRVVTDKSAYGLFLPFTERAVRTWAAPRLGDVAIVRVDGYDTIKRVIGLPGDRISIRDGLVVRNGVSLRRRLLRAAHGDEEGCVCARETIGSERYTILVDTADVEDREPVRVPEGQVYVLGDHRGRSRDSRHFGSIAMDQLKGRVGAHYHRARSRIECPGD
jgi:signal peptidase I